MLVGLAILCQSFPVYANNVAYVTGTTDTGGEPWGVDSTVSAMNTAFGSGNWDYLSWSTAANVFAGGYSFVYLDGGDGAFQNFANFIGSHRTEMESFVNDGGHLFLNAATWDQYAPFDLGFGASLAVGASDHGYAVLPSPIFDATTGYSWTGSWFSHDYVTGAGLQGLITDDNGNYALAELAYGNGKALLGGMTSSYFHSPDTEAFNLRVRILQYAASTPDTAASGALLSAAALLLVGLRQWRVSRG